MELGKSKRRPVWNYLMGEEQIMKTEEEKNLGVVIQENLNPVKHISKIFGLAYKTLTNIRVAIQYMDKDMMEKFSMSMIRPKLEYAAVVWSLSLKKDIRLNKG
ncbi:hypothetical protein E2C01_086576 [Portunus trituberculatus]|uniref:Uncharacterized protein n=1 Tax=Portunus trituberculatus TaxID=210409 RepID=A0A5B7J5T2_PORTR|nr:hypothetical protein [Portunus trituberculatus]